MKKIILPILIVLVISVNAQITDHNIYLPPAPPVLPAAGGTFVDATFGTTIMRVTDASDGADNHHAYSYWPCMNTNSTHLYVMQTGNIGPTLYDFDTINFSISNKRAMFASNCPSGNAPDAEQAIWSDVDPDIIFVHDRDLRIYSYKVSTQTWTLVKDLTSSFANGYHSRQLNKNHTSDDLFTFTVQDASYAEVGAAAWRKSTDQLYTYNQAGLDECQPDRAGNYLIVKTGNSGQFVVESKIIELSTGNVKDLFDGGPANPNTLGPYWGPGHGDHGSGTVIGNDNWNNRFLGRTCANADSFYVVHDWQNDWSQDYHVSGLADNENYILLSTYLGGSLTPSGNFLQEIFLVSTDGKDSVLRIAHHHTDYVADYNANGGGSAYWSSPKASISKNGKWVTFTSNWGSTTRKDVFVAKVPYAATTLVDNNTADENSLSVFPNPANDFVTVIAGRAGKQYLHLYNVLGEKVGDHQLSVGKNQIDVSSLMNGVYFYRIISHDKSILRGKMIVK